MELLLLFIAFLLDASAASAFLHPSSLSANHRYPSRRPSPTPSKATLASPAVAARRSSRPPDLLKKELLRLSEEAEQGQVRAADVTSRILAVADELASISPVADSASSALLDGVWQFCWNNDAEALALLSNPLYSRATTAYQEIDTSGEQCRVTTVLLYNDTQSSVRLFVDAEPQESGPRVAIKFSRAVTSVRGLPEVALPLPFSGWFDNVYLDSDFRVSRDSRGATFIWTRRPEAPSEWGTQRPTERWSRRLADLLASGRSGDADAGRSREIEGLVGLLARNPTRFDRTALDGERENVWSSGPLWQTVLSPWARTFQTWDTATSTLETRTEFRSWPGASVIARSSLSEDDPSRGITPKGFTTTEERASVRWGGSETGLWVSGDRKVTVLHVDERLRVLEGEGGERVVQLRVPPAAE
ncbi:unnamed protein product [Vitrella brassicaformis CCMP3155]|uniref:Plastid lipid-associated protein/fibrillin conserved domain-containing protein n=2 Tax=Vitrella brassicaformis TaxID=1169539 RepID=A0A0G4EE06_VITBC|nr:unnamed protein product [Vitrella brassicaformis CCMP3155]|mmetsp:Transcript_31708/g.78566  ORF Transcript_31708/g.78566 Transcript_31708/m.78566 type:complete len:417 (+) Transcript_31708:830-2080(+)|eukprot:CEL93795.1 unnamed protein product [Vitrella brassicaformis CCMP3155]